MQKLGEHVALISLYTIIKYLYHWIGPFGISAPGKYRCVRNEGWLRNTVAFITAWCRVSTVKGHFEALPMHLKRERKKMDNHNVRLHYCDVGLHVHYHGPQRRTVSWNVHLTLTRSQGILPRPQGVDPRSVVFYKVWSAVYYFNWRGIWIAHYYLLHLLSTRYTIVNLR